MNNIFVNEERDFLDEEELGKKVEKNWGHELWIDNNKNYCGKILDFKQGKSTSLHFHVLKKETWYILDGEFEIKIINTHNASVKNKILKKGDILRIERNIPHRILCQKKGRILEISTSHYESDSYRIEPGI